MSVCNYLVNKDVTVDCANPIFAGVEQVGVIINRADINFAASTVSDNIISAIPMQVGKTGFQIQIPSKTPFTGTKTEMAAGTNMNKFTNTVSFVVLDNSPSVSADIIDKLANGEFVIILQNKYKATVPNNKYQVYGWKKGLTAATISQEKYSADTAGGWTVELTEENTSASAMFFFATDEATTDTAFAALF